MSIVYEGPDCGLYGEYPISAHQNTQQTQTPM